MTNEKAVEILQAEVDKAIDDKEYMADDLFDAMCAGIKALEQESKTDWIPVSERLPEEDVQSVLFCDIDEEIMIGYHVKGRPRTHFSQDGTYEDIKNVKAWRPLPEPYKGSKEGECAIYEGLKFRFKEGGGT